MKARSLRQLRAHLTNLHKTRCLSMLCLFFFRSQAMLICYTVDSNGETILLSTHVLVTAHERSTLGVSYLFYILNYTNF